MKKKIDLSAISDEDLHAELNKRHEKETTTTLRGCIAKCWHCKKGSNLKRWFHIERYWVEDNVYTSHYNLADDLMIVCPNCNKINDSRKKWRYDTLTPNKEDLNELALYKLITKFHSAGGYFAKYYKRYDGEYGEKNTYYEVPDRYVYSRGMDNEDQYKKVEVSFR